VVVVAAAASESDYLKDVKKMNIFTQFSGAKA
jgi:hypothetical protein